MNAAERLRLGVVHAMPAAEYHAGPEVSSTILGALARSPAHCWGLHLDPNRPQHEPTDAMRRGTLAHALILEPYRIVDYAVKPPGHDGRTKEGKAWLAGAAGRPVVAAEEMAAAVAQRDAVRDVPELAQLLRTGSAEVSAFWRDDDTGLPCRCRPDWVHPLPDGRVILLDIKTTADVMPEAFSRSVYAFGYHRQAAFYTRGWEAAGGPPVAAFVFGAVTNEHPFIAAPYMLDDDAMQRGASECTRLLQLFAECQAAGRWRALPDGVQTLSLPAWAK